MTDIIQLKTAKYKGVELLFQEVTTTGGNRLIKFNFPGSDSQSIERQGKSPRSYPMTVWIPHEGYFTAKDNLLRVLEDGQKGVFTHPVDGDIENVINGEYTLTERISELGRASVEVTFEIDDSAGIPVQSGNLVTQVQAESDLLNVQLATDLAENYEATLSFTGNFSDALDNVAEIGTEFAAASNLADPLADQAADFAKQIRNFSASVGSLVQSPSNLAGSVGELFESLNNLYETPSETIEALRALFPFGDTDPVVNTNTVGRTERKRNRDLIRANMRAQSLSYAYLNAADDTYDTTDSLDLIQQQLEDQYIDVRDNQLLSNEALEQLDRVRVQGQKTLDNARVNTRSIITIETARRPLSVLVYAFYGSTDLVDTIAELNNIKQNAFVEGNVRILTE